jgi:uroporphyrinogen-III synthase
MSGKAEPLSCTHLALLRPLAEIATWIPPLRGWGAQVEARGLIEKTPLPLGPLDLGEVHWLIFTSAAAVSFFAEATGGAVTTSFLGRIAAVGEKTAEAIRAQGWHPEVVSPQAHAKGLLSSLEAFPMTQLRCLLPTSTLAAPVIPESLRARGASVEVLPLYRTECSALTPEERSTLIQKDALVFFSPSAVACWLRHWPYGFSDQVHPPCFAIGPTTAEALQQQRLPCVGVCQEPTVAALLEELKIYFNESENPT